VPTKRITITRSKQLSSPTPWIIVAVVALVAAALLAAWTARFVSRSTVTAGTILSLEETTSDGKTYYVPQFSYIADNGRTYNSISNSGSNPPAYTVGQTIRVRYERTNPANVEIDSFWELWGMATIFALAGLASFILSRFLKKAAQRKAAAVPPQYSTQN
jgi:hypothetical protein